MSQDAEASSPVECAVLFLNTSTAFLLNEGVEVGSSELRLPGYLPVDQEWGLRSPLYAIFFSKVAYTVQMSSANSTGALVSFLGVDLWGVRWCPNLLPLFSGKRKLPFMPFCKV